MSSLRTANSVVGLALWGKMWEKMYNKKCVLFFIKIQFTSNLKRKKCLNHLKPSSSAASQICTLFQILVPLKEPLKWFKSECFFCTMRRKTGEKSWIIKYAAFTEKLFWLKKATTGNQHFISKCHVVSVGNFPFFWI